MLSGKRALEASRAVSSLDADLGHSAGHQLPTPTGGLQKVIKIGAVEGAEAGLVDDGIAGLRIDLVDDVHEQSEFLAATST